MKRDTDNLWLTKNYAIAEGNSYYGMSHLLEELPGGELISYYRKGYYHLGSLGSKIAYKTSTDHGVTWSAETIIYTAADGYDIAMLGGGKTPTGAYVLLWGNFRVSHRPNRQFQTVSWRSTDGTTWAGDPAVISPWGDYLVGHGRMTYVPTRGLMQPWLETLEGSIVVKQWVYWSTDDGVSWGDATLVAESLEVGPCESSFAYLGDGRILGLVRSEAIGYFYQVKSSDYGVTWEALSNTGWNAWSGRVGSECQIIVYNGKLFVAAGNRHTKEFEVKMVDADAAWADAGVWGRATVHRFDVGDWLGYVSVLVHDKPAPQFYIAYATEWPHKLRIAILPILQGQAFSE